MTQPPNRSDDTDFNDHDPRHYELLEQLYVDHRDHLIAHLKKRFPLRSWEQCQDDVQEIFLVLAADGLDRLGKANIASLKYHLWRLVIGKIRELNSDKRGGHLFRASDDISELRIQGKSSTEKSIALREFFGRLDLLLPKLSAKELAIFQVIVPELPDSLSAQQILDLLPEDQRLSFFSKNRVPNPLRHARREVTRRHGTLKRKLRKFFTGADGQSGPFAA